jgi:hypothetical protein
VSARPFWTEADQAELDVLTHAFVYGFYDHRGRCAVCASGGRWCANVGEAFEVLEGWMRYRELRSRAEALRLERLTGLREAV